MSLALLFHYLMLNMFRMLIHPSWGACDLFVELFHGLYCSGSMCVGVTVWVGWGGVVSGCRLKQCLSLLNMFRMLVHPSLGACDLFAELFHGLYCSGMMCVGVTLWFGWGGVVSGCRLRPASGHCCKRLRVPWRFRNEVLEKDRDQLEIQCEKWGNMTHS